MSYQELGEVRVQIRHRPQAYDYDQGYRFGYRYHWNTFMLRRSPHEEVVEHDDDGHDELHDVQHFVVLNVGV